MKANYSNEVFLSQNTVRSVLGKVKRRYKRPVVTNTIAGNNDANEIKQNYENN